MKVTDAKRRVGVVVAVFLTDEPAGSGQFVADVQAIVVDDRASDGRIGRQPEPTVGYHRRLQTEHG